MEVTGHHVRMQETGTMVGKQETKHVSAEILENSLSPAHVREKSRSGRPHAHLRPTRL